jgi:hypothetical protein
LVTWAVSVVAWPKTVLDGDDETEVAVGIRCTSNAGAGVTVPAR